MNIFVLDKDPELAVKYLCNAHIVKMTLETCQLLSTQFQLSHCYSDYLNHPSTKDFHELYWPCYENHPCRKCLDNTDNYNWLLHYFQCICKEYTYRYGKEHSCQQYADTWFKNRFNYVEHRLEFPKCMPEEYREGGNDIDSVVRSYRNYYKYKSETLSRFYYTNRDFPSWIKS